MLKAAYGVIANVEGMILGGYVRIVAALHNKGVGLSSYHMNLGNQQTVNVPGDTPAHVTYKNGEQC